MSAADAFTGRRSLVDGAEVVLREWLSPSRFRLGDRLPTEQELSAMLGVSRGTLRSALQRLERTGEIVRRQGSGTYVGRSSRSGVHRMQPLRVESYSANARRSSVEVATARVEVIPLGADAAEALAVPGGSMSTAITRILCVAGHPASLTCDVFHPEIALPEPHDLHRRMLDGRSMFELMLAMGLEVSHSRTGIVPVLVGADSEPARMLKLAGSTACLELRELVFDLHDRPVLWACDLIAPDGFEVEVRRSLDVSTPHRLDLQRHAG